MKKIFAVLFTLVLVACGNPAPVPTASAVRPSPTTLPTIMVPTPTETRDLPSGEIIYNDLYFDLNSLIIGKDQVGSTPLTFTVPLDGYEHDVVALQMFPDGKNIAFQLRGGVNKTIIVTANRNLGYSQITPYQEFSGYLQIRGSQNPGPVLIVDYIEGDAASANIYQMVNPGDALTLLWTVNNPFINNECGYATIDPSPDGKMAVWDADFCDMTPPGPNAPIAAGSTWIYRIAVVSKADGVVYKFPITEDGSETPYTDIRDVSWSPDSNKLAYIERNYNQNAACLTVVDFINQPATATSVFCQGSTYLYDTSWSPDGTKIAVKTGDSMSWALNMGSQWLMLWDLTILMHILRVPLFGLPTRNGLRLALIRLTVPLVSIP
jgi:hypothetical protein